VLEGSIYNLGDFDECLSIDTGIIQGQYCLASLNIDGPKLQGLGGRPVHDAVLQPYPFSSAWSHIQVIKI